MVRQRTTLLKGNKLVSRTLRESSYYKDTVPTEHVEQRNFVQWFRQTYKPVRIFAIPNGGKRSKKVAMELKAEGVSKGVPDLFIPEWLLWIEMKRIKGGSVSDDQKDWHQYLRNSGYSVMVCKGFDAAKAAIQEFHSDHTTP